MKEKSSSVFGKIQKKLLEPQYIVTKQCYSEQLAHLNDLLKEKTILWTRKLSNDFTAWQSQFQYSKCNSANNHKTRIRTFSISSVGLVGWFYGMSTLLRLFYAKVSNFLQLYGFKKQSLIISICLHSFIV